jgi:hypothetical protein
VKLPASLPPGVVPAVTVYESAPQLSDRLQFNVTESPPTIVASAGAAGTPAHGVVNVISFDRGPRPAAFAPRIATT